MAPSPLRHRGRHGRHAIGHAQWRLLQSRPLFARVALEGPSDRIGPRSSVLDLANYVPAHLHQLHEGHNCFRVLVAIGDHHGLRASADLRELVHGLCFLLRRIGH